MGPQVPRDDQRRFGRRHLGGRLVDGEFAEGREEEEGAGEKADLAGPPLTTVRGVAATSAAQDKHKHSGR